MLINHLERETSEKIYKECLFGLEPVQCSLNGAGLVLDLKTATIQPHSLRSSSALRQSIMPTSISIYDNQYHANETLRILFQPRQTVLTAAGSIGQASGDLLRQIGENETDERFQVIY